ncbi:MAG: adenosylcobinamide amidohydrolase [Halobaculum sp.]
MLETARKDGVLRLTRPGTRWLSTGWDGGTQVTDHCYNVTVPEGWERQDLERYTSERIAAAGFGESSSHSLGPVLLTGVAQRHARGARCGPVAAVATTGVSNPAALPMDPEGGRLPDERRPEAGTVNVFLVTERAVPESALANLVAVVAEAKAATLLDSVGFPGTTSDAIVVGCDPDGERATFSGSATRIGAAARACVREAIRAGLSARYGDETPPESVAAARHGVSTDVRADVFEPDG